MTKKQTEYEKTHEVFKCLKSHRIITWKDLSIEEVIDLWYYFRNNNSMFPDDFVEKMNELIKRQKQECDVDEYSFL